MPAHVETLRELHGLHQRAKALRDRMASGPRTLAIREHVLATRQEALEQARKALKDARAHNKNREVQLQTVEARIDDLKTKRNSMRKQGDYDAITNQIAHDDLNRLKLEDEILQTFETVEHQTTDLTEQEAQVRALTDEIARLRIDLESQREAQEAQLKELEAAIVAAEDLIPDDQRDQYRRVVKQRNADAMAAVERENNRRDFGSCTGCNVTLTTQLLNELYTANHLVFCMMCGRILYFMEGDESVTRRKVR